VVGAHPQHAAMLPMDDHAISAPQVPDPSSPDAWVDTPTVEKQGSPDLDLLNVIVPHRPAEQRQRAEADAQPCPYVHHGQMVKGWCHSYYQNTDADGQRGADRQIHHRT